MSPSNDGDLETSSTCTASGLEPQGSALSQRGLTRENYPPFNYQTPIASLRISQTERTNISQSLTAQVQRNAAAAERVENARARLPAHIAEHQIFSDLFSDLTNQFMPHPQRPPTLHESRAMASYAAAAAAAAQQLMQQTNLLTQSYI